MKDNINVKMGGYIVMCNQDKGLTVNNGSWEQACKLDKEIEVVTIHGGGWMDYYPKIDELVNKELSIESQEPSIERYR